MAIYHFSAKVISRAAGRSSVAAAAYRAGEKLINERDGITHNYTKKGGVIASHILAPDNAPSWVYDRNQLWNKVEAKENRKDAQLARDITLALPAELDESEREGLVLKFVRDEFVNRGMVADIAFHNPDKGGDERNYHAHIMLTMRDLDQDGFMNKNRSWNDKQLLEEWRKDWEVAVNRQLQWFGHDARVSADSLKAQGIDREPTVHMGVTATQLERKGVKTERGDGNRAVLKYNHETASFERLDEAIQSQEAEIIQLKQACALAMIEAEQASARAEAKAKADAEEAEQAKARAEAQAKADAEEAERNRPMTLTEAEEVVRYSEQLAQEIEQLERDIALYEQGKGMRWKEFQRHDAELLTLKDNKDIAEIQLNRNQVELKYVESRMPGAFKRMFGATPTEVQISNLEWTKANYDQAKDVKDTADKAYKTRYDKVKQAFDNLKQALQDATRRLIELKDTYLRGFKRYEKAKTLVDTHSQEQLAKAEAEKREKERARVEAVLKSTAEAINRHREEQTKEQVQQAFKDQLKQVQAQPKREPERVRTPERSQSIDIDFER